MGLKKLFFYCFVFLIVPTVIVGILKGLVKRYDFDIPYIVIVFDILRISFMSFFFTKIYNKDKIKDN